MTLRLPINDQHDQDQAWWVSLLNRMPRKLSLARFFPFWGAESLAQP